MSARRRTTAARLALALPAVLLAVVPACREDDPTLDVGTPTSTDRPSTTAAGGGGPTAECPETAPEEAETLDGTLDVRFAEPLAAGQPVTWTLSVRSDEAETVTLVFPSGQDGDVVLERAGEPAGDEVYRWSDGTFFTQAVRCRELPPGATLTFELRAESLDVEPGDYTLRATLAASPAPAPVERPVTVTP